MPLPGNPAGAVAPPGGSALGKVSTGVGGALVKFVIPIAAFGGGYSLGLGVIQPLADFIADFVPFVKRMDKSVRSRSPTLLITVEIAALIIIGIFLTIAYLVKSFMGQGFWGTFIAVGVGAFGVGIGVRGIVSGFGPAKSAVEHIGA